MEQRILRVVLIQLKLAAAFLMICLVSFLYFCSSSSKAAGILYDRLPSSGQQAEQFITSSALKDEPGYDKLRVNAVAVHPAIIPQALAPLWQ
jgi:hypothetical protein